MVVTIETESVNPKPKQAQAMPGGRADPTDEYRKRMEAMGKVPQAPTNTGGDYVPIPEKYSTKAKSPLRVTLSKGSNELNFDLTD
jgi:hypothetical protein